jgi:hypothetical protein
MQHPTPDPSFDPNRDGYERYSSEHGPIQFQMTLFADGTVMYSGRQSMSLAEALSIAHDVSVEAALNLAAYKKKAEEN